jgi:hypothetical protein
MFKFVTFVNGHRRSIASKNQIVETSPFLFVCPLLLICLFCPLIFLWYTLSLLPNHSHKSMHATLIHNFEQFTSTIYLLNIFYAMCFFISKSDVCMAVSAKVQTKAPQANPLRRGRMMSSSNETFQTCNHKQHYPNGNVTFWQKSHTAFFERVLL